MTKILSYHDDDILYDTLTWGAISLSGGRAKSAHSVLLERAGKMLTICTALSLKTSCRIHHFLFCHKK